MNDRKVESNALGLPLGRCAAFTGYRPRKFASSFPRGDAERRVVELLSPVLQRLYGSGIRTFLTGMAEGFDLWAAMEVLRLRERGVCPQAEVAAVIPYRGQEARYDLRSADAYRYILRQAVSSTVLYSGYCPECFHRRNDFLVDNASVVVCYYDGQSGGTRYTVNRARLMGVPIVNICAPNLLFP